MSLEQQIAVLANEAAALNQTFQNKKAEIDAAVAAAVAAAPNLYRTYYVDAVNGDDNNSGLSTAPVQTLYEAIKRVPVGGYGRILVSPSQQHVLTRSVNCYGVDLWIENADPSADSNPVISPAVDADNSYNRLANINMYGGSLIFLNIDIDIPRRVNPSLPWSNRRSLVNSNATYGGSVSITMCGNGSRSAALAVHDGTGLVRCHYGAHVQLSLAFVGITNPDASSGFALVSGHQGTASIAAMSITLDATSKLTDGKSVAVTGETNIITNFTGSL